MKVGPSYYIKMIVLLNLIFKFIHLDLLFIKCFFDNMIFNLRISKKNIELIFFNILGFTSKFSRFLWTHRLLFIFSTLLFFQLYISFLYVSINLVHKTYLYVGLLSRLTVYVAGKVSYSLYYTYLLFIVNGLRYNVPTPLRVTMCTDSTGPIYRGYLMHFSASKSLEPTHSIRSTYSLYYCQFSKHTEVRKWHFGRHFMTPSADGCVAWVPCSCIRRIKIARKIPRFHTKSTPKDNQYR